MIDEEELLDGAGLPPCLAARVGALVGVIRSAGSPMHAKTVAWNAMTHLCAMRESATAGNTGLDEHLNEILAAMDAIENLVAWPSARTPERAERVAEAQRAAIDRLACLVEFLRRA